MSSMDVSPFGNGEYTIGWICALQDEFDAATAILDEEHGMPQYLSEHDNNAYLLGKIKSHKVVLVCLPTGKMGISAAASVASSLRRTFRSIHFCLLVGIGGGVPSEKHDIRLGDVVVSVPTGRNGGVVQYDIGTDGPGSIHLNAPPEKLLSYVTLLQNYIGRPRNPKRYVHDILVELEGYNDEYACPGTEDRHFQTSGKDTSESEPGFLQRKARKNTDPVIHLGTVASGSMVIADRAVRDRISEEHDASILCFEMEAAGLMNHLPCLVIRGISDYADSQKNDEWRFRAIAAAAAYAKALISLIPPFDVSATPEMAGVVSLVQDMKKDIQRVENKVNDIREIIQREQRDKILDWLTPINYGSQQSENLRTRQPGTLEWFVDSTEYKSWKNDSGQILFCPGIPGAGKTILASTVVDNLNQEFRNDANVGIAYIFCSFRCKEEQTTEALLSSLLKQLAQQCPTTHSSVKDLYDRHSNQHTRPSVEEIVGALYSVGRNMQRVFIVVDALDECSSPTCRKALISAMIHLHELTGPNILVTSRFVPEIAKSFENYTELEVRVGPEDIERYIEGRSSEIFCSPSQDLLAEIKRDVTRAADGMFLVAKLYLDSFVTKTTAKQIKLALKGLRLVFENAKPHNDMVKILENAYKEIMERIKTQGDDLHTLATRMLGWVVHAKRPLTTRELQHALAVEIGDSSLDQDNFTDINNLVSVCAGLVTVDKASDTIGFVHYTAQKYFEESHERWFPCAQRDIAMTCITYLQFGIFNVGACQQFVANQPSEWNALYKYAAKYWSDHARAACMGKDQLALRFLQNEEGISGFGQGVPGTGIDYLSSSHGMTMEGHVATYFRLVTSEKELLESNNHPNA